MKTLFLLRHASAGHPARLSDHDRPLDERGLRDAPQVGAWLLEHARVPDIILSSTATRARQTSEMAAEAAGYDRQIQLERSLYLADPESYLDLLRLLPPEHDTALITGHNPGLESLVYLLTGQGRPLKPSTLVHLELPTRWWSTLSPATRGRVIAVWHPGGA